MAAHRERGSELAGEPETAAEARPNSSRRAQEAAARVAARYAQAPSYSEMLATEARAALRAAEAASRAALQAQAAAESVLAGIEAANAAEPGARLEPDEMAAEQPRAAARKEFPASEASPFSDPFFARRPEARNAAHSEPQPILVRHHPVAALEPDADAALHAETGRAETYSLEAEAIQMIEPVPIPGNLIEFPREVVASRKARPRLAEGPRAAAPASVQLRIFEIDPVAVPAEPEVEAGAEAAQSWVVPAWPGIELAPHPESQSLPTAEAPALHTEDAQAVDPAFTPASALETAPATLRLMAMVVDSALVTGAVLTAALAAASRASTLPSLRVTEIGIGIALIVAAGLYETLFLTLGRATPGMIYARIRLANFEGQEPDCAERSRRLRALLVSALPAGLGLAWSLFDENHLSWHDRLSRTYPCKR